MIKFEVMDEDADEDNLPSEFKSEANTINNADEEEEETKKHLSLSTKHIDERNPVKHASRTSRGRFGTDAVHNVLGL